MVAILGWLTAGIVFITVVYAVGFKAFRRLVCITFFVALTTYMLVRSILPDLVPGGRFDTFVDRLMHGFAGVVALGASVLLSYDLILWGGGAYAKKPPH